MRTGAPRRACALTKGQPLPGTTTPPPYGKFGLGPHNAPGPQENHECERSIQISRPRKHQKFLPLESVLRVKGMTNSILPVGLEHTAMPRFSGICSIFEHLLCFRH